MDSHIVVDNMNKSIHEMTPEERIRFEHRRMHETHKHQGHDAMHVEMIIILFITVLVAQVALVEWKKRHYRSYLFVTLIGMWIIPVGVCLKNHWMRFVCFWLLFSTITAIVVRKALMKPISGTTPRLVYKWFCFVYKLSYGLGIFGYIVVMLTFLGFNFMFNQQATIWMDVGFMCVFYGLYFGVLGRDISEICTDKMAANIGYYTGNDGMPIRSLEQNVCAVCGNELLINETKAGENTFKLSCRHVFHEFCIRGWCIIGKKQTCPYCKEKVDLKRLFSNPWERPHVLYGQLLDWIRWLLAWQPVILLLVQGINWALGLS